MKRRFILSLAVLFLSLCAFAQSAVVGSVVDKNGEPVTGAAVIAVVNGAKVGAVADFDGKFSISVPKGTSLEFSALGFKTISVPAASGMTVVLEEDIDQLEETVIIGYGSVKKKDLLGSVSTVRQQSLIDRKSSGVVVCQVIEFLVCLCVHQVVAGEPVELCAAVKLHLQTV